MGSGGGQCHYCRRATCVCPKDDCRSPVEVDRDRLASWKAEALAILNAADARLRPLVENLPGALGRNIYDVAADEIKRLEGESTDMRLACNLMGAYFQATLDYKLGDLPRRKAYTALVDALAIVGVPFAVPDIEAIAPGKGGSNG